MSECDNNCNSCATSNSCSKNLNNVPEKLKKNENVKKIIGVVSGKGGVGKSFVTSMLAVMMKNRGNSCSILDADITGPSIPQMFGIHQKAKGKKDGIIPQTSAGGIDIMSLNLLIENEDDPVVWRGPILMGAVKQFYSDVNWNKSDYLFIDMPPGTSDVPLTVFQSIPLDGIIIVTSPQDLVSMVVRKAIKMAQMMDINIIGLVENYSYLTCPKCGEKISIFNGLDNRLIEKTDLKLLGQIPLDGEYAQAADRGDVESINFTYLDKALNELDKLN